MIPFIDIEILKTFISQNKPMTLLDVRRKDDYEAEPRKIEGAVWRDPLEIDTWMKTLPPGKKVVAYCKKGGPVSQSAVEHLVKNGLDAVFLKGGIKEWLENQKGSQ